MKKSRLIFYWVVLSILTFIYYGIGQTLYLTSQININSGAMVGLQLIALLVVPFTLVLGLLRFWLLKPVGERTHLFDVFYFVIPTLMIITCFRAWIWVGITLSAFAGILIVCEFIWSITKLHSLLLKHK